MHGKKAFFQFGIAVNGDGNIRQTPLYAGTDD
jgi:hypothetical protein